MTKVQGRCPMGCGETLFLGEGGYISCSWLECPVPDAVSTLLEQDQADRHIVLLGERDFSVLHPLRERLGEGLFECGLHRYLSLQPGAPKPPGRYVATVDADEHWRLELA